MGRGKTFRWRYRFSTAMGEVDSKQEMLYVRGTSDLGFKENVKGRHLGKDERVLMGTARPI